MRGGLGVHELLDREFAPVGCCLPPSTSWEPTKPNSTKATTLRLLPGIGIINPLLAMEFAVTGRSGLITPTSKEDPGRGQ